ncbi:MAG: carboxymuconolactone decarboxylase family protein [Cellvibrionaceae bacterium]
MSSRINPVSAPYSEAVQASFKVVMPEGMPPLSIFRTMANNPRVLSRMVQGGLLDRGSITVAERELVILRSCALCGAEYEWGVHAAAFSAQAGFSDEQIAATCAVNETPLEDHSLWSSNQRLLLAMVDELHSTQTLSDALWGRLSQKYSSEQLVELVMLAGLYHAVSFVVNAFQIEREVFAPSFPV